MKEIQNKLIEGHKKVVSSRKKIVRTTSFTNAIGALFKSTYMKGNLFSLINLDPHPSFIGTNIYCLTSSDEKK